MPDMENLNALQELNELFLNLDLYPPANRLKKGQLITYYHSNIVRVEVYKILIYIYIY